jgi:hypothetical protein
MPRFFFCAVTPKGSATDLVGEDCRDLSEAKEIARRTAAELVAAQLKGGQKPSGWLEVVDEEHRPIFMLPFRAVAS